MIGAVVAFTAMALTGRSLASGLDTFEIMTYRSLIGLCIITVVITLRGAWPSITTRHLGLHLLRNTCHFTAQNLWFLALTLIPLAKVFALEFTAPLWVLLLSPIVLRERLTPMRALSACLGFAGILMVARPGTDSVSPGVLAAGSAAVFFAVTTLSTKKLTERTTTLCIMFWMTAMQPVLGAACGGIDLAFAVPALASVPLLIVVGCAGLFAHFCVTTALSLAPATVVTPIDFARLPLAVLIGALFLGEPMDVWTLIGAAVIFGGNYLNIWQEGRNFPTRDDTPNR